MIRTPSSRRLVSAVVLLGVLLHLPGLFAGFYIDDYLHQLVLGRETPMSRWALFDFGSVDAWQDAMKGTVGAWPFWTSPEWSVRFLRPLSSAVLVLDHALFGSWAMGYALAGLVWFAATLVVVQRMLRALGASDGVAALALLFFASSGSTVIPVEWTANRNSLIEVLFVCAAVWAAARGRPVLGFAAAIGAVLAKESGVLAFALVPMALALSDRERAKRWAPVGVVLALAYVVSLVALGYGTNSAFYVSPWSEPLRYAGRLVVLTAVAIPSLVAPFPVDIAALSPDLALRIGAVGAVLSVPIVAALVRFGRGAAPVTLRWFLGLWVGLAIAAQGAAPYSDRLLIVPAVAASALVAQVVAARWHAHERLARFIARAFFVTAGPLAALATLAMGGLMAGFAYEVRTTTLTADVGAPSLGHRTVFVVQCMNGLVPFALANTWAAESRDQDLRFHLLQSGRRGLRWSRTDERTFVFESLDRPFLSKPFELVYLAPGDPERLTVGRRWRADGFTVEVARVDAEGVRALTLVLDEPPGPGVRFLVADGTRLVHRDPPEIGETVVVPAPVPPSPFVP